jgi:hypothetical protein
MPQRLNPTNHDDDMMIMKHSTLQWSHMHRNVDQLTVDEVKMT